MISYRGPHLGDLVVDVGLEGLDAVVKRLLHAALHCLAHLRELGGSEKQL